MLPQTSILFANISEKLTNKMENIFGPKRFLLWPTMPPTLTRWQSAVLKRCRKTFILKLLILLQENFIADKKVEEFFYQPTIHPAKSFLLFLIFRCWQMGHVLCRMLVLAEMPGKSAQTNNYDL